MEQQGQQQQVTAQQIPNGQPPKDTPEIRSRGKYQARAYFNGEFLGTIKRNKYGYWVSILPFTTRYYVDPLAVAYDMVYARRMTREDAAKKIVR